MNENKFKAKLKTMKLFVGVVKSQQYEEVFF
jgi:hypothetical protein